MKIKIGWKRFGLKMLIAIVSYWQAEPETSFERTVLLILAFMLEELIWLSTRD